MRIVAREQAEGVRAAAARQQAAQQAQAAAALEHSSLRAQRAQRLVRLKVGSPPVSRHMQCSTASAQWVSQGARMGWRDRCATRKWRVHPALVRRMGVLPACRRACRRWEVLEGALTRTKTAGAPCGYLQESCICKTGSLEGVTHQHRGGKQGILLH